MMRNLSPERHLPGNVLRQKSQSSTTGSYSLSSYQTFKDHRERLRLINKFSFCDTRSCCLLHSVIPAKLKRRIYIGASKRRAEREGAPSCVSWEMTVANETSMIKVLTSGQLLWQSWVSVNRGVKSHVLYIGGTASRWVVAWQPCTLLDRITQSCNCSQNRTACITQVFLYVNDPESFSR